MCASVGKAHDNSRQKAAGDGLGVLFFTLTNTESKPQSQILPSGPEHQKTCIWCFQCQLHKEISSTGKMLN